MAIPDTAVWITALCFLAGLGLLFSYFRLKNAGKRYHHRTNVKGLWIAGAIIVVFIVFEVPLLILFVALILFGLTSTRFIHAIDAWQKPAPVRRKGNR